MLYKPLHALSKFSPMAITGFHDLKIYFNGCSYYFILFCKKPMITQMIIKNNKKARVANLTVAK